MNKFAQLQFDIDGRVTAIRADNPDWLCRLGCDSCCRRLAEIPELTLEEWHLLREGLAILPEDTLSEIGQAIAGLAERDKRPIVCPLLDPVAGACRVYPFRPIACRTYGFYVQHDKGLYCHDIEVRVADGEWAEVVWGNQDAIDRRLRSLGESRKLTEWFADWDR